VNKNDKTLKLILFAMTILLMVVCSSNITETQEREAGIMGIVTDQDSVQLPGVRVSTFDGKFSCLTDTAGRFLLDSLETGMYDLRFTLHGYETGILEDIELSEDKPGAKFWVVLKYSPITR
jgi:hypothetical protein